MRIASKIMAAAVAAAVVAGQAGAQQFNFSTTGQFTSAFAGCNDVASLTTTTCTGGGFTLTFTGVPANPTNYLNNSVVSLGSLALSGTGNVTVPPATVGFRINVNNLVPSVGTGSFVGFITGQVTVGGGVPSFSSLVWTPNLTTTADGVTYNLIVDSFNNGINIPANQNTDIKARAFVTATPEPASMALLATGLVGLAGFARRRRAV